MNEKDWLASNRPWPMLKFLQGRKASERKMRLFAVACCRRIWYLITEREPRCALAVELAERFADGEAHLDELAAITNYPRPVLRAADAAMFTAEWPLDPHEAAYAAADAAAAYVAAQLYQSLFPDGYTPSPENINLLTETTNAEERTLAIEFHFQSQLLRCIFGNPFRPITIDPAWLTPDVTALAQAIYEERSLPAGTLDTTRLAILADALEEAGCNSDDILSHCRSDGPHVRGCWVVDLLLGK